MFKKILVPFDNSKPATEAAKYAARLAKFTNENCEIILLHVVPNIPTSPLLIERPVKTKRGETVMLSEYVMQLYEEMKNHALETLVKIKKEIEPEAGRKATIRTVSLIGDSISTKIIELAEKEKVELVVIGNVGLSGLSKLKTLGSVSRAVSEQSPCPVLIIH